MSTFGQNGSEKGLKGSFRPFSRVSHYGGGGQGGRPPPKPKSDIFSGWPPSGPTSPMPLPQKFPQGPLPNFSAHPFKIRSSPPPSEMNLFLYDFLEITRFYTVNFPFIKLFFQKNSSFFFQKPIFKHGRPPSPPIGNQGGPTLALVQKAPP